MGLNGTIKNEVLVVSGNRNTTSIAKSKNTELDLKLDNAISLTLQSLNGWKNSKAAFSERYPSLTFSSISEFVNNLEIFMGRINEEHIDPKVYADNDEYVYLRNTDSDYDYIEEDKKIDKLFLKEYLENHPDKKQFIAIDLEEKQKTLNELLDNPEVLQALKLITGASGKQEVLTILNSNKTLLSLPLLQGDTGKSITKVSKHKEGILNTVDKNFKFFKTLLQLECPLLFAKEMANVKVTTKNLYHRGDYAAEILRSDMFYMEYVNWGRDTWKEIFVYLNKKSTILVGNYGHCNYNEEENVEDIKEGIWNDFLNKLIEQVNSFCRLISDYDERRIKMQLKIKKEKEAACVQKELEEISNTFFNCIKSKEEPEKSNDINTKNSKTTVDYSGSNISEEVTSALSFFKLSIDGLTQKKVNERYRELIKENHPDVNNNSSESEEIAIKLNQFKPILINYLKEKNKAKKKSI